MEQAPFKKGCGSIETRLKPETFLRYIIPRIPQKLNNVTPNILQQHQAPSLAVSFPQRPQQTSIVVNMIQSYSVHVSTIDAWRICSLQQSCQVLRSAPEFRLTFFGALPGNETMTSDFRHIIFLNDCCN